MLDDTEEVRRLGMGRLLEDMSKKMQKKVDHSAEDPMRLLIHSTHDTTLAGICATLDVFDEKCVILAGGLRPRNLLRYTRYRWPAFTSHISFELFRKKDAVLHNQSFAWQTVLSKLNRSSSDDYCKFASIRIRRMTRI